MPSPIGHQLIRDFSGGQVSEASDSLTPMNVMRLILNMDGDVVGALRVRPGVTAIGNQIQDGKNCLGLYNFRDSNGSNNQQVAVFNNSGDTQSVTYYNNAGTWTAIGSGSTFTASAKSRFTTFVDYVFRVSSAQETPKSWTGASGDSWGATNLTSVPSGKFICVYKARLYIAATSTYPDRLFFSSIPDATTQAITWDTTNDHLDVVPSDNGNITGLTVNGSLMLIFKDRAMYRWNGSSADPDRIIDVGCCSQESIATRRGTTFFCNDFGVFATTGGFPTWLSKPIDRWWKAISSSYLASLSAVCDDDNYYVSVGDVTVDGGLYSNAVYRYNISSQTWTIRSYAEQIYAFAEFVTSTNGASIMCGNDDGDVQEFNVGLTDATIPIMYRVRTKRMDFLGSFAFDKTFSEVHTFGFNLEGAETFVTTNDEEPSSVGQALVRLWAFIKGLKYTGRWFVFELVGESKGGQGEFAGWEIGSPSTDGKGNGKAS